MVCRLTARCYKWSWVFQVLKTRWTMFDQLPDNTNAHNGEPASRQTVYYRVIGWPSAQESMHGRAYAIRDTARGWSTTFKELQKSALPDDKDKVESMMTRLHDVLRGWTVQVSFAFDLIQKLEGAPCVAEFVLHFLSQIVVRKPKLVWDVYEEYRFSLVPLRGSHAVFLNRLLCSCGGMG